MSDRTFDDSILWGIADELEDMERDLNEALDELREGGCSEAIHWVTEAKARIKAVMGQAEVIAGHRLTACGTD